MSFNMNAPRRVSVAAAGSVFGFSEADKSPAARLKTSKDNKASTLAERLNEAASANPYHEVFARQMALIKDVTIDRRAELQYPGESLDSEEAENAFEKLAKIYNFKKTSESLASKTMSGLGFDEMLLALLQNPIPNMDNEEFIDVFNDIGAVLISLKEAAILLTSLSAIALEDARRRTAAGKLNKEEVKQLQAGLLAELTKTTGITLSDTELNVMEAAQKFSEVTMSDSEGAMNVLTEQFAEHAEKTDALRVQSDNTLDEVIGNYTAKSHKQQVLESEDLAKEAPAEPVNAMTQAMMDAKRDERAAAAIVAAVNAHTGEPLAKPATRTKR